MIAVTRLDGSPLLLDIGLIVAVEQTPDTLVSLTTGDRVHVREAPAEVLDRVTRYKQSLARVGAPFLAQANPL